MSLKSIAQAIEALPFATAISESGYWFPSIETVHVIALALVVGSIATVDLRLLGFARRDQPAWQLAKQALPWTWVAFVTAVITGALLFSSAAVKYVDNWPFRIKMLLLILAGLNMALFHRGAGKTIEDWDDANPPAGAKLAGGLSLIFWIGVVALGRWIGFTDNHHF